LISLYWIEKTEIIDLVQIRIQLIDIDWKIWKDLSVSENWTDIVDLDFYLDISVSE